MHLESLDSKECDFMSVEQVYQNQPVDLYCLYKIDVSHQR